MSVLYSHGGSGNHGCEALARTVCEIIDDVEIVYSLNQSEDVLYKLQDVVKVCPSGKKIGFRSTRHIFFKLFSIVIRNKNHYVKYEHSNLLRSKHSMYISIGGDNYCYNSTPEQIAYLNKHLKKNDCKLVLWGCSIEPVLLNDLKLVSNLKEYDLITARETITYKALLTAGLENTRLLPDSAFILDTLYEPLPKGLTDGNMVGINVSPLVIASEKIKGITIKNYKQLIQHIIDSTNMQIALIPHVVWKHDDDRKPLEMLNEMFASTGRVVLLEDNNSMVLKGYIARCRFFIASRTHASIAAYSSCVPTLVVGYSVKARGIAYDLFGTVENYVLPVQDILKEDDLTNAFRRLQKNETAVREHLETVIPNYIEDARNGKIYLKNL